MNTFRNVPTLEGPESRTLMKDHFNNPREHFFVSLDGILSLTDTIMLQRYWGILYRNVLPLLLTLSRLPT